MRTRLIGDLPALPTAQNPAPAQTTVIKALERSTLGVPEGRLALAFIVGCVGMAALSLQVLPVIQQTPPGQSVTAEVQRWARETTYHVGRKILFTVLYGVFFGLPTASALYVAAGFARRRWEQEPHQARSIANRDRLTLTPPPLVGDGEKKSGKAARENLGVTHSLMAQHHDSTLRDHMLEGFEA